MNGTESKLAEIQTHIVYMREAQENLHHEVKRVLSKMEQQTEKCGIRFDNLTCRVGALESSVTVNKTKLAALIGAVTTGITVLIAIVREMLFKTP